MSTAVDTGGSSGGPAAPPSSAGATSGSQESIAHKLHLPWWPQGDPGRLRDAALAYRAAATALTDAGETAQRGISDVCTSNTGTPIDAMGARWSSVYYGRSCLSTPSAGAPAIDNAVATCNLLAQACEDYAQHIDDARHRLEELAAELVAGLVVGGLLTFVTAGLSDAAAAANAARVVTAALELADTVGSAVTIAFRIGGLAIQGAIIGAGSDLAMQVVRVSVDPQASLSFGELVTSTELGAVAGPVLAGGGAALGRLGMQLDGLTGLSARVGELTGPARTALRTRFDTVLLDGERGSASVDLLTGGLSRLRAPAWLQRIRDGSEWHTARQAALRAEDPRNYAEVHVAKPAGADGVRPPGHNRVDGYNDVARLIRSMKHTQLAKIDPATAKGYLDELARKYPPGTPISSTATNPLSLWGQQLRGRMVLEVPHQVEPIPQWILDYAKNLKITIRQVP